MTDISSIGTADPSGRECGTCRACCIHLGITEMDQKRAGVPCKHLSKVRQTNCCTIYNRRPTACQTFLCAWRQGMFADHMRPDRAGMLVAIYKSEIPDLDYSATITITDRRRAGSLQEGALQQFIHALQVVEIDDIRIISTGETSLIWFCKGLIRQGRLLESPDPENLKFEAYDPPLGTYGLQPTSEKSN